jgi:hypothetical protein
MKQTLRQALFAVCAALVITLVTACGPDENPQPLEPTPVLPPPQVGITRIPATPTATPTPVTVDITPTAAAESIQPLPTVDPEEFLLGQIDWYINKIEGILRSTDTNIKP